MRGIHLLHPELQPIAVKFEADCKAYGDNIAIGETLRTVSEQNALYAQGRTAPGNIITNAKGTDYNSYHQWGVAFDIFRNIKGQEFTSTPFFERCGGRAASYGLRWGVMLSKTQIDYPHIQWEKYGTIAQLKTKYGTPEKFMATWKQPSTPANPVYSYPVLRKGSKGEDVKLMQRKLGVNPDGVFGPITDTALRAFQAKNGLAADGACGPATWPVLLAS